MSTTDARYAISYPALNGDVVTQGHTDYCAAHGHAHHTVAGLDTGRCPRCGEVNDTKVKAANAARDAVATAHARRWDAEGYACSCGRTFRRSQGLGQHLAAVDRKAQAAWDTAYDATPEVAPQPERLPEPYTITARPAGHAADGTELAPRTYLIDRQPEDWGDGRSRIFFENRSLRHGGVYMFTPAVVLTESIRWEGSGAVEPEQPERNTDGTLAGEPPTADPEQLAEAERFDAEATTSARLSAESWERSDTDGYLSQWASDTMARVHRAQAALARRGGWAEHDALFDAETGALVAAKPVHTRYGMSWALLADDDPHSAFTGWLPYYPARRSTLARRGYTEGTVLAPSYVEAWAREGSYNVMPRTFRKDGGFSRDVYVVTRDRFTA